MADTNLNYTITLACRTWPSILRYRGSVTQAQSSFYFVNVPRTSPEPIYTLTYSNRPSDIPKDLQLLYFSAPGGVHDPYYVTMPDMAWFSPPIPTTIFGVNINCYFYGWMQSCNFNVMVIDAPYGVNAYGNGSTSATKGAGNNVITYVQHSCYPTFTMVKDLTQGSLNNPQVQGDHVNDLVIGVSTVLGIYTNAREGL